MHPQQFYVPTKFSSPFDLTLQIKPNKDYSMSMYQDNITFEDCVDRQCEYYLDYKYDNICINCGKIKPSLELVQTDIIFPNDIISKILCSSKDLFGLALTVSKDIRKLSCIDIMLFRLYDGFKYMQHIKCMGNFIKATNHNPCQGEDNFNTVYSVTLCNITYTYTNSWHKNLSDNTTSTKYLFTISHSRNLDRYAHCDILSYISIEDMTNDINFALFDMSIDNEILLEKIITNTLKYLKEKMSKLEFSMYCFMNSGDINPKIYPLLTKECTITNDRVKKFVKQFDMFVPPILEKYNIIDNNYDIKYVIVN